MTNPTIAKQAIDQQLIVKANEQVFHPAGFALVVRGTVDQLNEELIVPHEIYLTTHPVGADSVRPSTLISQQKEATP